MTWEAAACAAAFYGFPFLRRQTGSIANDVHSLGRLAGAQILVRSGSTEPCTTIPNAARRRCSVPILTQSGKKHFGARAGESRFASNTLVERGNFRCCEHTRMAPNRRQPAPVSLTTRRRAGYIALKLYGRVLCGVGLCGAAGVRGMGGTWLPPLSVKLTGCA
jgi:hypothetical protein